MSIRRRTHPLAEARRLLTILPLLNKANSPLLDFLLRLQEDHGGVIPFERYMQEALYHPGFGYYSKNIRTVGRRGDFATSATLGEALGAAIANWIRQNRRTCPPSPASRHSHLIEIGAGSGELARTVLRRLGPLGRWGLHYHIVESSPILREEQRARLPQYRVRWHDSVAEALAAAQGRALIFSNELIDAFPCRIYERRDQAWHELGVQIHGSKVSEALFDRTPIRSSAFETPYPEGQRIEVHFSAAEWLASWAPFAREATLLTIDYGGKASTLYDRRPRGTARAYFHQQRLGGREIYHRFGRQDITCDVNFTDLQNWGERLGWKTLSLTNQSEFLAAFGSRGKSLPLHDAMLSDLSGAGDAFKVLTQHIAGPPNPEALRDFRNFLQAPAVESGNFLNPAKFPQKKHL